MAIGSAPEIGTTFSRLGDYPDYDSVARWFVAWREMVGDNLMGGYGTLCTPDPGRMARITEEWNESETG